MLWFKKSYVIRDELEGPIYSCSQRLHSRTVLPNKAHATSYDVLYKNQKLCNKMTVWPDTETGNRLK